MKLILSQHKELTEVEVEIRYIELDAQVESLSRRIKQSDNHLYGEENGRQYRILFDDILYIESVDRKTFIYTSKAVYRSAQKMTQLLDVLRPHDFVQINKACVLNINALGNVKTLLNSRMEGTLTSGEKVSISRTYLPAIKAAFAGKGGEAQ